jgi:hypothetical protein
MSRRLRELATLGAAAAVLACQSVRPTEAPGSSVPSASVEISTSHPATASPSPTDIVGQLDDGVPVSVDGEHVFRGDELRTEIERRSSAESFLAGGWFRGLNDGPVSCVLFDPPPAFRYCREGFGLYDARTGPWEVRLAINDPPRFDLDIPYTQERPAVLRIHTHDAACLDQPRWNPESCPTSPVLDALVWLGPIATEPAAPTAAPSQPTGGLSRREAIDRAREEVAKVGGFRFPVACTAIKLHSDSLGGLDDGRDPWLWIIRFEGEGRHNSIVLEYFSGRVVMYEAGTGGSCDDFAGGIG